MFYYPVPIEMALLYSNPEVCPCLVRSRPATEFRVKNPTAHGDAVPEVLLGRQIVNPEIV